jgi:hypothetical protein
MIKIKVTFSQRDEIVGAIVRALAVQCAGFQVVGGLKDNYLTKHGYYPMTFSNEGQLHNFSGLLDDYLPERFKSGIKIETVLD